MTTIRIFILTAMAVCGVFQPAVDAGEKILRVPTPGDGPRLMSADRLYRSAMEVALSPDGKTLYVSDFTAGAIVVLDAATGEKRRDITVPGQPVGLAVSKDDSTLYVADYGRCKVLAVDTRKGSVAAEVAVGRRPFGIALAPKANRLYACNLYTNDVSVIDAGAMRELARIKVVREPRFVAVTPDESKAVVSNSLPVGPTTAKDVAMDVSVLDLRSNTVAATLRMVVGASNGRGVAVSADGQWGYVAGMRALFNAPVTQIERGWELTSVVHVIDLKKDSHYATVVLDSTLQGAPNPYGLAASPDGRRLYVGLAGTSQVVAVDVEGLLSKSPARIRPAEFERDEIPATQRATKDLGAPEFLQRHLGQLTRYGLANRLEVRGNGPRGMCVSADGKRLYVASYYSGSVACLDTITGATLFSKTLGPQPEADAVRRGEMYYNDAQHGFEEWASCASCHPEGRADGLNWDLINDGIGNPKETKSHLYAEWTPPVMARGVRATAEMAVRTGFKWIQFAQVPDERVADIREYMKSLRPEPSPYLTEDGKLSEAARRGKAIFRDEAVCGACHSGPYFTNRKSYDVGTLDPQFNNPDGFFDTPTLVEIWRTGPYLHDGRALTIEDVFTRFNKNDRHGVTSKLTKQQVEDLSAYMLSIGTEEPVLPHPEPEAAPPGRLETAGAAPAANAVSAQRGHDDNRSGAQWAVETADEPFLEASRRKFEEARLRAERLPGQIGPLLRAGRYEEAAQSARNAAKPFAQIDAVELFFERWWLSAELMAAQEKKVAEAIAAGKLASKTRGQDPNDLCELAGKLSDTNNNWDMLALGLLYLYRGGDSQRAMECFRVAERRGWDMSWFTARALDGRQTKETSK
jgi:YVTN family beta-propeller protein